MTMIDRTGEPRKIEEFEEALKEVNKAMLDPLSVPPMLMVHMMTIKDALGIIIAFLKLEAKKNGN